MRPPSIISRIYFERCLSQRSEKLSCPAVRCENAGRGHADRELCPFRPYCPTDCITCYAGDKIGLVQLLYVAVSTTIATHSLKRLLDDVWVGETRLGQRPHGGALNMPSGHSSMASCAVYFIGRRYSVRLGVFLLIILGLTMYARVALNAYTVSAVIAGALLGCLTAAWFTSPRIER